MSRPVTLLLQLLNDDAVPLLDHFVEKKIVLDWQHLLADCMVATKPYISLFSNQSVEIPFAIRSKQFWEVSGITVLLAEGVCHLMLV